MNSQTKKCMLMCHLNFASLIHGIGRKILCLLDTICLALLKTRDVKGYRRDLTGFCRSLTGCNRRSGRPISGWRSRGVDMRRPLSDRHFEPGDCNPLPLEKGSLIAGCL